MSAFGLALGRVAGTAAVASLTGWLLGSALLPRGRRFRAERLGWSFALGCALIAATAILSFAVGARVAWMVFFGLAAAAVAAGLAFPVPAPRDEPPAPANRKGGLVTAALGAAIGLGVAAYALRAMTEPMWANDFLAIWGLKGKTLFAASGLPARLTRDPAIAFSHPEYPLGLPLVYAGVALLTGRWDDHAAALLFPLAQVATLCALAGWLRRRGAPRATALSAAAIVALMEPLYSAFLTGMAEVPLALGALLFGCALADALSAADHGSIRRLAVASVLIAATKNEGLLLAGAGALIALAATRARALRPAAAALVPALLVRAAQLPWRSRLPVADFDLTSFSLARVGEAVGAAARLPGPGGWAAIALFLVLVGLGRRSASGDAMLALAACALAAYLLAPAFAVRGPEWLVETTLRRAAAALLPLLAAATALRLAPLFSEGEPTADG